MALQSKGDGPLVHVRVANRILVTDLEPGDEIAIHSNGTALLTINESGTYNLDIKDRKIHVKRLTGNSPVNVFVEHERCH